MRKLITLAVLATSAVPSLAANNTIFSCTATNGSPINVVKSGKDYLLSYGKNKIKNPINEIMSRNNTAVLNRSGYITYSLEFHDKGNQYYLQYRESVGDGNALFGGVFLVKKNTEPKGISTCNLKKKVQAKFEYKIMPQSGTGF